MAKPERGPSRTPVDTPWRPALFLLGVLILLLALVSPLDVLGDIYLFSAHMAQHLLLVLVVPPLLLLGVPPAMWAWLLSWAPAARVERVLRRPLLAWLIGVGTLWVWHAPPLYEATLASEGVHIVEHLCFLVSAAIFWWPVLAPAGYRLAAWWAVTYLVAGAIANTALAILLTFAPAGIYPSYLHPADPLGILPLLRDGWRLTPQADQQLGGVLMWIPGGWVYLLAIVGAVARWYMEPDDDVWVDASVAPGEGVAIPTATDAAPIAPVDAGEPEHAAPGEAALIGGE